MDELAPFDPAEHNGLVMRRLAPVLEQEWARLPPEVAARWGIEAVDTLVAVCAALAEDLDDDGCLWLRVWIDGVHESWFAVDARACGIFDVGGEVFIVPPVPAEVDRGDC
jgi:hypothetical protein